MNADDRATESGFAGGSGVAPGGIAPLVRVCSFNEFDPLRSILVGMARGANHPEFDPSFNHFFTPPNEGQNDMASRGPISARIVTEIEEDIDGLVRELRRRGVVVYRADAMPSARPIQTPHWRTEQL